MGNSEENIVYGKVYDEERVKSTFGPSRTYLIRLQDVSWGKNGNFTPVVFVAIEYNGIPQIRERPVVPHYLIEPDKVGISDFTRVLEAMQKIKTRNHII